LGSSRSPVARPYHRLRARHRWHDTLPGLARLLTSRAVLLFDFSTSYGMWIERGAASGWRRATCNKQCAQPHVELLHARSHEQVENCVTQLLHTGFVLFTQFRNGLPLLLPCASPPAEAWEQQAQKDLHRRWGRGQKAVACVRIEGEGIGSAVLRGNAQDKGDSHMIPIALSRMPIMVVSYNSAANTCRAEVRPSMLFRKSTGRVATRTRTAPDGTIMRGPSPRAALPRATRHPRRIQPEPHDHDRGRRRTRFLRSHHDRHEHGRLVRRAGRALPPCAGQRDGEG
jgi:hypothetical protein